jgi:hypothetical protein
VLEAAGVVQKAAQPPRPLRRVLAAAAPQSLPQFDNILSVIGLQALHSGFAPGAGMCGGMRSKCMFTAQHLVLLVMLTGMLGVCSSS